MITSNLLGRKITGGISLKKKCCCTKQLGREDWWKRLRQEIREEAKAREGKIEERRKGAAKRLDP